MYYLKRLGLMLTLLVSFNSYAQQITPTVAGAAPFCAGTSLTINLAEDNLNPITFNVGNDFVVKLIDGGLNATTIATIPGVALPAFVNATIPASTPSGNYQIRVEATATTPVNPTFNTTAAFAIDGLPTATAGGNATICVNSSYTLTGAEATATNGSILWTHNGTGSITNATTTTPTYTAGAADAGTGVTLTMTVTSTSSCAPLSVNATYTVNVDPLPTATAGGSATICVNSSYTLTGAEATATNGSILWTHNGTGSITNATTTTPTYTPGPADAGNAVTLTLTVTSTNTCAPLAPTAVYTVNVNPLPTASAGGNATICVNSSYTLTGAEASATNGNILWTHNGNGSIANANTTTPTFTPGAADAGTAVTLTMTVTSNNTCAPLSVNATYTVNVDPLPTANAGANQSVCVDGSTAITGATATNGTIQWTHNGAGVLSNSTTLTPNYAPVAADAGNIITLTLTVTSNNTCGAAIAVSNKTISVGLIIGNPSFPLPNSVRCQGAGNVTYTATALNTVPSDFTYSLDPVSAAFSGNSINTATGQVTYAAGWSGISTITATANGCGGPKSTLHTVTTTPSVSNLNFIAGTAQTRCKGDALTSVLPFTATASNTTGITYALDPVSAAFPGNSINGLTGQVTFAAGWFGTSVITATAAGCNAPTPLTHTIVTVDAPVFSVGNLSQTCEGVAVTTNISATNNNTGFNPIIYSINAPAANAGIFINPNSGVLNIPPNSSFFGIITVTAQASGCASLTATHPITVNPKPVLSFTNKTLFEQCSGSVFSFTVNSNPAADIRWQSSATNVSGFVPSNALLQNIATQPFQTAVNQLINTTNNAVGTVSYVITPQSAVGCLGNDSTINFVVNPKPTVTTSSTPAEICSDATTNIQLSASTPGVNSFNWSTSTVVNLTNPALVNQSSNPIAVSLHNTTDINPTGLQGSIAFNVVATSDKGCAGVSLPITQLVNPKPNVTSSSVASPICSDGQTNIPLTASTSGSNTFAWTASNASNISNPPLGLQTGNPITATLENTTDNSNIGASGSLIFNVIPTSDKNCTGPSFVINQSVRPKPKLINIVAPNICSNTATNIQFQSSTDALGTNSYAWTTANLVNLNTPANGAGNTNPIQELLVNNTDNNFGSISYLVVSTTDYGGGLTCAADTAVNITQRVNPTPTVTTVTPAAICSDDTTSFELKSSTDNLEGKSQFSWTSAVGSGTISGNTNSGAANPTFITANVLNNLLHNSSNANFGTVNYTIIAKSATGNCVSSAKTVTQRVNPIPKLTVTEKTICSRSRIDYFPAATTTGTSAFSWQVENLDPKGFVPLQLTNASNNTTGELTNRVISVPTKNTQETLLFIYTITSADGCTNRDNDTISGNRVLVTINPTPDTFAIESPKAANQICVGSSFERFFIVRNGDTVLNPLERLAWSTTPGSDNVFQPKDSSSIFALIRNTGNANITVKSVFTTSRSLCSMTVQKAYQANASNGNDVNPELIMKGYKNNDTVLICLANDVDTAFGYRWGKTRKSDLMETRSPNERGQELLLKRINNRSVVDTNIFFYWVEVKFKVEQCERRIYLQGNEPNSKRSPVVGGTNQPVQMKIYPNPATDKLTLELLHKTDGQFLAAIYDVAGKLLRTVTVDGDKAAIAVDDLQPGYYIITCSKDGFRIGTEKFIKH